MSTRTRYSIIKGIEPDCARELIAQATKSLPGPPPNSSKWSDWTHVVKSRQMVALACPDALIIADDAWPLAQVLARLRDAPHLELRIQEGDHWDFTLYRATQVIADFSTRVSYFDGDRAAPRPWKQGDPTALATLWNVPPERVKPYLVDWDRLSVLRPAVDGDQFSAGDSCQVFDFMRAIGVDNPFDHPDRFQFEIPFWESAYVVQPAWRRAIRQISVWIKGAYPDVPRPTREQRVAWERRRASVRVVRVDWSSSEEDE